MRIGHFMRGIWDQGGIATYIHCIGGAQRAAGHTVFYLDSRPYSGPDEAGLEPPVIIPNDAELFAWAKAKDLDILHLHTSISLLPPNRVPTVRTLQGHSPYCPSGSRHFTRWGSPCNRAYSLSGCMWGHLVDRCGSARPSRIFTQFQTTWQEMRTLPHIPVLAASQFLKDQMVRSGYPENMIHVLRPIAPDVASYSPPPLEGEPRFLFMGRIVPEKGVDCLLRALREVKTAVHLDIVGAGYAEEAMRMLTSRLGLTDKVTFHGWVSQTRVNEFIQGARALVYPSVWHEPGGIGTFEAMAHSRAVIVSRVGGMPEVLFDEVNGLLVEPNNATQLSQSIERLAKDWTLTKRLGDEGKKLAVAQFSLRDHMDRLMRLYALIPRGMD